MRAHREAGVEQQDPAIGPWCEQTAFVGRCGEAGIVILKSNVDVLERWGSRGRWADGKGETVCLVYVVVGILAENDGFDCVERCMARPSTPLVDAQANEGELGLIREVAMEGGFEPGVHILSRRKDLRPRLMLLLQKSLQFEKFFACNLIFQFPQPTLMQSPNLQRQ